jgi:hypothetical protein
MIIDNFGIRAFNQQHQKIAFNVEKYNNDYIISEGDDYFHYEWNDHIIITKLSLHGSGIYHITTDLDEHCYIVQYDCVCHLYHLKPNMVLDVKMTNGILIGCDDEVKQLYINTINSVVKHFHVTSLLSIHCQKSIIRTSINHFTTVNQSIDDDSNVIINHTSSKL